MFALMVFAAAVSITQLAALGSWTRSVRLTTLLQAVALGAMVCAPVAVALEWALTRAVAAMSSRSLAGVVATARWTYDPVVEELVKLAPLALGRVDKPQRGCAGPGGRSAALSDTSRYHQYRAGPPPCGPSRRLHARCPPEFINTP